MDGYEHVKVIGKGSFGLVSQIRRKSDGKILVWKEVNYGQMSEKEKQLIVTEVNILRELRHPYIVKYLDRVIDKSNTKIYIVQEFCDNGDLGQFIKQKKRRGEHIDEKFIWKVFTNIFLALKECHQRREGNVLKPILHRDIKPQNVFLDSQMNAKLGDFGLARNTRELTQEAKFAQTNVGTPYYMSPEMVNELHYDERSDIWALGCLLYEMAALSPPFDATNHLTLAKKINAAKFKRIPEHYSENLFQVIRWMLHRLRSRRPRIEDLERLPQLASSLQEQNTKGDDQQLKTNYHAKVKELQNYEESLRRLEATLSSREAEIKTREAELDERETRLKSREKHQFLIEKQPSPMRSSSGTSPTYSSGHSFNKSSSDSSSSHSSSGGRYSSSSPRRQRPPHQIPQKTTSGKYPLFPRFDKLSVQSTSPLHKNIDRHKDKRLTPSPLRHHQHGRGFPPAASNNDPHFESPGKAYRSRLYERSGDYEIRPQP